MAVFLYVIHRLAQLTIDPAPAICILLNDNSNYCHIPRSSKHIDTCKCRTRYSSTASCIVYAVSLVDLMIIKIWLSCIPELVEDTNSVYTNVRWARLVIGMSDNKLILPSSRVYELNLRIAQSINAKGI